MITARCNHCDETIYIADDEKEDQILDSHQVHIMKSPQAAFIYEATTHAAWKKINGLRATCESMKKSFDTNVEAVGECDARPDRSPAKTVAAITATG
jgi:hypothetical protein